ncbi:MAG: BatA domain-containing protein [Pseudomonadota bacterium]
MELSFASAAWAWGLASLALPILIHFFASREQLPRRFAGMRFLPEGAEQGQARRISDWLLLLLRLLLLTCLVAALMAPTLHTTRVRDQQWLLRHPALPALTDSEAATLTSGTTTNGYWLCRQGLLQALTARCAEATGAAVNEERFLLDLIALATREPSIAALTVQVPPQLASSMLSVPTLPFPITTEVVPVATSTARRPWSVAGPASYAPLFAAANHASTSERWQWQRASVTAEAANSAEPPSLDHSVAESARSEIPGSQISGAKLAKTATPNWDLVIGRDDRHTPVRWHDQPLPWQLSQYGGHELAFHLEGEALHLRVADAASLRADPAQLALLLQVTDSWLARGLLRQQEDSRALLSQMAAAAPAGSGEHAQPLQTLLLLAAVLLLLAERGLAHARR